MQFFMQHFCRCFSLLLLASVLLFLPPSTGETIMFGQTADLTGPSGSDGVKLRDGIRAAFFQASSNASAGDQYVLVTLDDRSDPVLAASNAKALMSISGVLALVGTTSAATSEAVLHSIASSTSNHTLIGPMTSNTSLRTPFNPNVVHIRGSWRDEAFAIIKVILEIKKAPRVLVVHSNTTLGRYVLSVLVEGLSGHRLKANVWPYSTHDNFPSVAAQIWATNPQTVVFADVLDNCGPLMVALEALRQSRNASFVTGSWAGVALSQMLQSNPQIDPTNYYQIQPFPSPIGTSQDSYRAAMRALYGPSTALDYVTVEGYLLGRFLITVTATLTERTPSAFSNQTFSVGSWSFNGLSVSSLSKVCPSNQQMVHNQSQCPCNQGQHAAFISTFTAAQAQVTAAIYTYSFACSAYSESVYRPANVLLVQGNNQGATSAMNRILYGFRVAAYVSVSFETRLIDTSQSLIKQQSDVLAAINESATDSIFIGAFSGVDAPEQSNVTVFQLFSQPAMPTAYRPTSINLLSSLEQELFVAAKHVVGVARPVYVVQSQWYGEQGMDITKLATDSLGSFGRRPNGVRFFNNDTINAVLSDLPSEASAIVLGLRWKEIAAVLRFLNNSASRTAYLPFNDVALFWPMLYPQALLAQGYDVSLASRLFFATAFPSWMNETASTMGPYCKAVFGDPVIRQDPMTMIGFVAGFVYYTLASNMAFYGVDAPMADILRSVGTVAITDMSLGPFTDKSCHAANCKCNVGARTITLLTVEGLVNGYAPEMTHFFSSCDVPYDLPGAKRLSVLLVAGVATVLSLVFLGLVTGGTVLGVRMARTAHAPKDPAAKFTTMFVSLKRESELWEQYPKAMTAISACAADILEKAVATCCCFKVKKVGCATMIVATETQQILDCAASIMNDYETMDWSAFIAAANNKAYAVEHSDTESDRASIAGREATPIEFSVGIHRSVGRICHSAEGSLDYGGPSVDGAAIAVDTASGGQILVTASSGMGSFPPTCFTRFAQISVRKQEFVLLQFTPPGRLHRVFEKRKDDEASVDSIAATMEQQASGVTLKRVVVLDAFCPAVLKDAITLARDDVAMKYMETLKWIFAVVQKEKGHVQSFNDGRLTVTFNAVAPTPQSFKRAYKVAAALTDNEPALGKVTCGIAVGKAIVGSFKAPFVGQHNAVVGGVVEDALRLQMLCEQYDIECLSTSSSCEEAQPFAHVQFVDVLRAPRGSNGAKLIGLVALMGLRGRQTDEWMYELEEEMAKAYQSINAGLRLSYEGSIAKKRGAAKTDRRNASCRGKMCWPQETGRHPGLPWRGFRCCGECFFPGHVAVTH